jgi:hypothetical protein
MDRKMDSAAFRDVQHREAPRAEETATGIWRAKEDKRRWLNGHEVMRLSGESESAATRLTKQNKRCAKKGRKGQQYSEVD